MQSVEQVAEATWIIDSKLLRVPRTTGVFFLDAERPALVETSAAAVLDNLMAGLEELGSPEIEFIVVTHIHLDHAGAAGDLAEAFPGATVVVSERGARHVADPSRLQASAARIYGEENLLANWGALKPVPPERLWAVGDGDVVDLGDRKLDVLYTPGHAKHHIALHDDLTSGVFMGDSGGIYLADYDYLTPTTPPPDLDLPLACQSLDRIAALAPELLFYTHFAASHEAARLLDAGKEQLIRWGEIAERGHSEGEDPEAIAIAIAHEADLDRAKLPASVSEGLERFAPVASHISGYLRYFDKLGETEGRPAAGTVAGPKPTTMRTEAG